MIKENALQLKAKILGLMSIGIILVGLIGIFGAQMLSRSVHHYDSLMAHEVKGAFITAQMNLEFKRQVQEWKNILIRGHNQADLDKYWGKFKDKHERIQVLANDTLKLDLPANLKREIQNFSSIHSKLLAQYQQGRDTFIDTGFDHIAADQSVRGIDREPSQLLEKISNDILNLSKVRSESISKSSDSTKTIEFIGTLICVVLIAGLSTSFVNMNIVKPLTTLTQQAWSVSHGDYSHQVEYLRNDEIGKLSEAIEVTRQQLSGFKQEMDSTMDELDHVCGNVGHSTAEISKGVNDQDLRIENVATAMNEMSLTASSVSENAGLAAESANSAEHAVQTGNTNMSYAITAIQDSSQQILSTTEVIGKLNDDASNISTVLDVIKNIAEQTNLLALNAAIEAARAGEQGRGFAVVADEVRTLAQKTQHSTTEIQEIIDRILAGAENAVKEIDQVQKHSEISVTKVEEVDTSLSTIMGSIEEIRGMNNQIATAASEQAAVASEIAESLHLIKDISVTNSQHADTCSRENTRLITTKSRLEDVMAKLSRV